MTGAPIASGNLQTRPIKDPDLGIRAEELRDPAGRSIAHNQPLDAGWLPATPSVRSGCRPSTLSAVPPVSLCSIRRNVGDHTCNEPIDLTAGAPGGGSIGGGGGSGRLAPQVIGSVRLMHSATAAAPTCFRSLQSLLLPALCPGFQQAPT